mgnify:CR=1 FL=1
MTAYMQKSPVAAGLFYFAIMNQSNNAMCQDSHFQPLQAEITSLIITYNFLKKERCHEIRSNRRGRGGNERRI